MNDTSPPMEKIFHDKIMSKSGEERLKMGVSMFESAKSIIISSIPNDISEHNLKVILLKRFYENDFEYSEFEKIIQAF